MKVTPQDLRDVADWLEAHPEVSAYQCETILSCNSRAELVSAARAMGTCHKDYGGALVVVSRNFGSATVKAMEWKTRVCKRTVVGVEHVAETFVPAHDRPVYEYDCSEPLLKNNGGEHTEGD